MRALKHQHTHFKWTQECEEEFQMMKKVVGNVQFLQPFNIRKELMIFTEASKEGGLGFVLCQLGQGKAKTVIQCGSTSLTPVQANYSVTEIELLAILWSLEKTTFYTKGAPVIKVYSDHSALVSLCCKELIKVPNQHLINIYNYTVKHLLGL